MNRNDYKNLDGLKSFKQLQGEQRVDLKTVLTSKRIAAYTIPMGGGLNFNYAASPVNEALISLFQELANEQQLIEKYREILNGELMNTGEGRMVLHHLTRGQLGRDVVHNGKNSGQFYARQQNRVRDFASKVHNGEIKGSTGKKFDTVVQIGIGGSDLGPRAIYLALQGYVAREKRDLKMKACFISNVDPDDVNQVLDGLDFETTLFILVTKSGTTQESLTNRQFVLEKMRQAKIAGLSAEKHMIVVTSETSPLAGSPDFLESFYLDDFIGGRYSSTSAVGGAVLSLAFGPDVFDEFLSGAHQGDKHALNPDIRTNASLMDALIGVYQRNILNYPTTAILPYSQGLIRFPAHLQQLDMESNGKSVNRFGEPLVYSTGPVIFGEPGTNGQHSFYQLLHQGTDITPLQFIGFKQSQIPADLELDGSTSQRKLNANLAAQITAFALGKKDPQSNRNFQGNRPSTLIWGEQLTPYTLGILLAHFENKVMFQGLTWNINSFDQEGVQLGKALAKQLLSGGEIDPVLAGYGELLTRE